MCLEERSNAEKTIALLFSVESALLPSGFRLSMELEFVLVETYSLSTVMSFSVRTTCMRALMILYFAVK